MCVETPSSSSSSFSLGTLNEDAVIECRRCVLGEARTATCCCALINATPTLSADSEVTRQTLHKNKSQNTKSLKWSGRHCFLKLSRFDKKKTGKAKGKGEIIILLQQESSV